MLGISCREARADRYPPVQYAEGQTKGACPEQKLSKVQAATGRDMIRERAAGLQSPREIRNFLQDEWGQGEQEWRRRGSRKWLVQDPS